MSAAVHFRPMTEADLDRVVQIENAAFSHPWSRNLFADGLKSYDCWLMFDGDKQVGHGIIQIILDEAHLLNIGVGLGHQRQGHGARMLQEVIGDARVAGAKRLLLEVRRSNRQAVAFYRRSGFTEIGVRRAYYPAVAGREDALVFEKELR